MLYLNSIISMWPWLATLAVVVAIMKWPTKARVIRYFLREVCGKDEATSFLANGKPTSCDVYYDFFGLCREPIVSLSGVHRLLYGFEIQKKIDHRPLLIRVTLLDKCGGPITFWMLGRIPSPFSAWSLHSYVCSGNEIFLESKPEIDRGRFNGGRVAVGNPGTDLVGCLNRLKKVTSFSSYSDYVLDLLQRGVTDELNALKSSLKSPRLAVLRQYTEGIDDLVHSAIDPSFPTFSVSKGAEDEPLVMI